MKTLERFSGVFLLAGLFLFVIAIVGLAGVPVWMIEKSSPMKGLPPLVPESMEAWYPDLDSYHAALTRGRDIYIREACWHCHSQYVRPTANESLRYGPVSAPGEYQTPLHLPQLFGTRRVGPDLSREAGKKSNDWQLAHLYAPMNVVPQSVMPAYPWMFDIVDGVPQPNDEAKALVAYIQNLGADVMYRKEALYDFEKQTMPPRD